MGADLVWFDAGEPLRVIVQQARAEGARYVVLRDRDRWHVFETAALEVPSSPDLDARHLVAKWWSNPVSGPASVLDRMAPALHWSGGWLSLIGEATIGRAPDNSIHPALDTLSKHHARIYRSDRGYLVEDVHSTSGTFVNGVRITAAHVLHDRDAIQCGGLVLGFVDHRVTHPSELRDIELPTVVLGADGLPVSVDPPWAGVATHGVVQPAGAVRDAAPEATSVTRYPAIDARELGAHVQLTIDLTRAPVEGTHGDPVTLSKLSPGWQDLPIAVRVSSPQLELAPGDDEGTIRIRRDAASTRCQLVGTRRAAGPLEVTAVFSYNDRWCGTATRTFDAPSDGPSSPALAIDVDAHAPDLTIHIHRTQANPRQLVWTFHPRTEHRATFESATAETTLADDPATYIRAHFRTAGASRPGLHVSQLRGFGESLWQLAPRALHDGYWALRDKLGDDFSIQLLTDEPHMPWELMRPVRKGTDTKLLAETHPIARGLLAYPHRLRQHLPRPANGQILTVAPDYAARSAELPPLFAARDESTLLKTTYGATSLDRMTVKRLLAALHLEHAQPIRLLHFAGHGRAQTPVDQSILAFEDDDVTIAQIRNQDNRLGERYHPFVILNACEAGAAGDVLGEVGGWAEALLYREFGGLIAPLWAVFDDHARTAMTTLLDAILTQHTPIAEALRDVRAAQGPYSPTPLSYVFYGDVHARFE